MNKDKQINIRLSEKTMKKLLVLKSFYKKNTSEIVDMLINQAYMTTEQGKEEIKEMMNKLNEVNELIEKMK